MTAPALPALSAIERCGVVAIIRGPFLDDVGGIVEALVAGGILAIEISLTSERALDLIERAVAAAAQRAVIGAGTVVRRGQVDEVFRQGAAFVVSPVVDRGVIAAAVGHGMLAVPGAYTPTEVMTAVRFGAEAVKLFPADSMSPAFVRALLVPLPGLKLVPTGGVSLDRAREFAAAGAWAVGVGSPLVSAPIDPAEISLRASWFTTAMRPAAP